MEEIETEIGRLSLTLKLESLRLEKEEMNVKQVERIDQKWPSNHMGSSPQKENQGVGSNNLLCSYIHYRSPNMS
ncbi:hypothetical protein FRX31_030942, partial [Thalictrum thalictroides]